MHTGEIVDLANERRLSAVLDFTRSGAELLILNGGSRAEEFVVVATLRKSGPSEIRSVYCIDSGTSMQVTVSLFGGRPTDLSLRIVGGHGEMVLCRAAQRRKPSIVHLRGGAALAVAATFLMLTSGRLEAPGVVASADPEPASVEAPLVQSGVSLRVVGRLPKVEQALAKLVRPSVPGVPVVARKTGDRRIAAAIVSAAHVELPTSPAPRMTDLHVPTTAKSGDFIPVSFGAVGRQIKIVASIGPTIVSKTIVSAQRGVIAIHSPKSDLDSRIMTVRAYAQDGNRTSVLEAMVVLVHP